jgi:4-(2-carboxyphenyl)-2-oxobut-3-enoate aldolase
MDLYLSSKNVRQMVDQRLTVDDVEGIYALMPTPATEDAATDPEAEFTVDLAETRRGARRLVADDVDAIMLTGTFGEAHSLTDDEYEQFTAAVIDAVDGETPVIAGPTTVTTRETIKRAKIARDLGADGAMCGRPMWCKLPPEGVVDFYRDVAEAVPELGIVAYDNPGAFKGRIRVWDELAAIDNVVGAKFVGIGIDYRTAITQVRDSEGDMVIMPIDRDWLTARTWYPDRNPAAWSSSASCGPLPVTMLRDAMQQGNDEAIKSLVRRITATQETFFPDGSREQFYMYNVPVEKIRFNAAGYIDSGPSRRPYHNIPDEHAEGAALAGERWRGLVEELEEDDELQTALYGNDRRVEAPEPTVEA